MARAIPRLVVALAVAVGSWLAPAASTYAASPAVDPLIAPAHMAPSANPPSGVQVKVEIIKLTAAQCAKLPTVDCTVIHKSWGVNHQPLPKGTTLRATAAGTASAMCPADCYWYWSWWDQIGNCVYIAGHGGCLSWTYSVEENGDANGSHVYRWNNWCTAGGNSTSTWCGYFWNGGGYPNYAMQFGGNVCAGIPTPWGWLCFNHGQRRWIDDYGNPGGYYYW
jgi:hypothetical protein